MDGEPHKFAEDALVSQFAVQPFRLVPQLALPHRALDERPQDGGLNRLFQEPERL